jgi:hypothetical protein
MSHLGFFMKMRRIRVEAPPTYMHGIHASFAIARLLAKEPAAAGKIKTG